MVFNENSEENQMKCKCISYYNILLPILFKEYNNLNK